jgi:hypothetical protein
VTASKSADLLEREPDAPSQLIVQPQPDGSGVLLMFERLAKDPSVDVEKLERLIAMQERIMRHQAKAAFDAAFAEMQGEIPVITEKGEILVKGELRSRYATNEDIQEIVKPILQRHGFSILFRNEFADNRCKVIGILSHRGGHSEQDEFVTKPDDSGGKNDIQALGSARSYGQRYTTTALLNIATRGTDDDGKAAGEKPKPDVQAPKGFEDWWADLQAVSDNGLGPLTAAWNASKIEFRNHLARTNRGAFNALRDKAAKVKA